MDVYQIALKMMHLPAGLFARAFVEMGRGAVYDPADSKLTKLTATAGFAIPSIDMFLEYSPVYKNLKDGVVQVFTGGQIQPPNLSDQVNDFFWFDVGYFAPELLGVYNQSLQYVGKNIKKALKLNRA